MLCFAFYSANAAFDKVAFNAWSSVCQPNLLKALSAVAAAVAEIALTTALHALGHSGRPQTNLAEACTARAANTIQTRKRPILNNASV